MKTYRGDVRALDGVSLVAETGTVFGLLGPNGAGKSTTVKILTTLSRPDAGEARVAGYDVVREAAKVRLAIGCVAQKSGLDPAATGRENLMLQGRVYGMRGRELKGRAQELLERFGLAEAADRTVRTYSGGMQRKLDVAVGPHAPAAGALPRRADHRARPGGARGHVVRDRAPGRRRGPHDPAHDALPGRGRSPGASPGDRRPAVASWRRARPTSSRRSCAATPSSSSSRSRRRTARCSRALGGHRRPARRRRGGPHAARAGRQRRAHGADGARRPGGGRRRRSPRSPSRARRSTMCTCATPARRSARTMRR